MRGYSVLFLSIVCFVLISCASVNTKLMYNPQTGDVKECKRDPWKNWEWEEEAVLRTCANEYKKLGYIETNDVSDARMNKTDPSSQTLKQKLQELKSAYDDGLITEQEYSVKRTKLLDEF